MLGGAIFIWRTVQGDPKKRREQNAHGSIDGHLIKYKAYQIEAKHVKIL